MAIFGNTAVGTANSIPANYIFGSKFTVTEGGTVTKISAYLAPYSGTARCRAAIYSSTGAKLAEGTSEISVAAAGWYDFPLNYTFTAGTYWLAIGTATIIIEHIATGVSGDGLRVTPAYFTYPTFPTQFTSGGYLLNSDIISIYATYTPSTPTATDTTLTFTCTPTNGLVPWTATFQGTLIDAYNVPVQNAPIMFRSSKDGGATWTDMFASSPVSTDFAGAYSLQVAFTEANGWAAGTTALLQAVFAGDANYNGDASPSVTVTMDTPAATWTLTLVQSTGGTISSTKTVYNNGETATVNVVLTAGYTLTGWLMDNLAYDATSNPLSFAMNSNHTVQAIFTAQPSQTKTFGNTAIGTANSIPANYIFGSKFVVAEGGTISKISAYLAPYSGISRCRAAIYSSTGAKLAESASEVSVAAAGWYDFPLTYTFVAGTYWLAIGTGTIIREHITTGVSGDGLYVTNAYFTYPTFPTQFTSGGYVLTADILSIYATYTTGALSVSVAPSTPQTILINTQLTFTATPVGGTPSYTVNWLVDGANAGTGTQFVFQRATAKVYTVQATASDSGGSNASSNTVNVTVSATPPPTITVNPTSASITTAETKTFTATVADGTAPYTITWIDDGSGATLQTSTGQVSTYVFPTSPAGEYSIHAHVVDNGGQQANSASVPITVIAVISGTTPSAPMSLDAGTYEITVQPQIVIGGVTYNFLRWEDNSTSNPRTLVLSADTTVTATYQPNVPNLTAEANGPYSAHITDSIGVYFAGSATGGVAPYSWLWNFGDGFTSTLQNPTHKYASAGTYTATLTVTDSSPTPQVANDTASVTITPMLPPIAAFTYAPTAPTTGQTVNFDGSASHAQESGATITSYQWNFGDGATGSGASATHVYSTTGSKTVVLTVTDSLGQSDTETATVNVSAPPTWSLTVTATAGGSTSWSGTRVYAAGQPSDPVTATRNPYNLFGNWVLQGTNVGSANPYTVAGQTAGTALTLQAVFAPAPTLVADAGGPYSAHITSPTVQFYGSASGGVEPYRTWIWNFGDGNTSTQQNPQHTYASAATFNVTLQVIDTDGLSASDIAVATVSTYYPPTANFTSTPPNPMVGQTVTFDGSTSTLGEPTATITSYAWNWGDGSTGSGATTTHVYATDGTFHVSLTVTDSFGSSNTKEGSVTVSPKPKKTITVQAGPNGTTNPAPSVYVIDYDVEFRVTAQPNAHHKFSYWNADNVISTSIEQVIPASATPVTESHLLTAYFEILVWTLAATASAHGTIQGTAPGQYIDGTAIEESAKPDDGYLFDYWLVNGSNDTRNPQTFIMDKDYSLTAYFKPVTQYTVGGTVQDATGAPVMEVRVSAQGTAYATYTIADGSYLLELPSGTYTVVFEKAGYATVNVPNVSVTTGNVVIAPVTISSTPELAGFPWYVVLIGAGIAGAYFIFRGTKKRSR